MGNHTYEGLLGGWGWGRGCEFSHLSESISASHPPLLAWLGCLSGLVPKGIPWTGLAPAHPWGRGWGGELRV